MASSLRLSQGWLQKNKGKCPVLIDPICLSLGRSLLDLLLQDQRRL